MSDGAGNGYTPRRECRLAELEVRSVRYRIREWGPRDAPPVFLLHGARDTSASFQFLVDELPETWRIVAPDWRGHGGSDATPGSYWLSDFALDLDRLLDQFAPGGAVALVGHSMGGNVAALYAGLNPERISSLVILDALGSRLEDDPTQLIDTLHALMPLQRATGRRVYASLAEMAQRLLRANRRLDPSRAAFLARTIAQPVEGGFRWPYDPTFRRSLPTLHTAAEWAECWHRIKAPTLLLLSSDARPGFASSEPHHVAVRTASFQNVTVRRMPDTGHNLHHDVPVELGVAIKAFIDALAFD